MRPRSLVAPVVGVLLAAGALVVGPARAQQNEGVGIRLTEAPAARKGDPRAQRFVVDHVAPGTTFERDFEVVNHTDVPMEVALYAAGATIVNGRFAALEGRTRNELSEWVSVTPDSAALAPGEALEATMTISVPADATGGERYAAVLAERPASPAPGQIGVATRAGIRLYISVGAGKEPETDFELPAFRPVRMPDGRPAIEIDGCNTGGRAIDLSGDVELTDGPGGVKAGPFPTPNTVTIAPEDCHTFTIPLDKELPLGPWDASAKLRSGKEERTAQARITFPKEPGERGKKVETRQVTGTLPGILALGISIFLLLLLAGWLLWFLLKRRARRRDDEEERAG